MVTKSGGNDYYSYCYHSSVLQGRSFHLDLQSQHFLLFFFNDTATTEIYTLSLHDALPISSSICATAARRQPRSSRRAWRSPELRDRKSTRLNSSHVKSSYAVFCLKNTKPHVIGPPGRVAGQHADGPLEQPGGCPQALVVAGLAGQVGMFFLMMPPPPRSTLFPYTTLFRSFWSDVRVTLTETLVGFAIALALGLGLGIVLGRVVWLEQALRPVIVASQVVPKVALIPLFIIWFGFGITSKIIIVALLSFFPILLNVILGVRSVDTGHRDVMRSLNAGRWQTFRRLEYPSTLPYVLAGMED